ncbi:MAG: glycosyltransferase [Desulfobacteraceae bacterium]|jgi:glycosyltransferase involved in cell wall biosynthesis/GT2 family glycosyltransferase|nr:glycosyltransferase [Desulfobacteraceae bacterium]
MNNNMVSENQSIRLLDVRDIDDFSFSDPKGVAVIMPCTDADLGMETARILYRRAEVPCIVLVVIDSRRQGFIKTLNQTAARISTKYIVYLAQDAWPGRGWLKDACDTLDKTGKGLLAFNDGKWKGRIASFGMVRTSWVQSLYKGRVLSPVYVSHAADNELTVIARALDMHVYNPDCTLVEVDPNKDGGGSNPKDRALFKKRFLKGFNGLVPLYKMQGLARDYNVPWKPVKNLHGVSIIILANNRARYLNRLLQGFFKANTHLPVELIIVDHGSSGDIAEVVSHFAARGFIRLINRKKKETIAGLANLVAEKAKYDWLLFLKNDAAYTSDIISASLARLSPGMNFRGIESTGENSADRLMIEISGDVCAFLCRKAHYLYVRNFSVSKNYVSLIRSMVEKLNVWCLWIKEGNKDHWTPLYSSESRKKCEKLLNNTIHKIKKVRKGNKHDTLQLKSALSSRILRSTFGRQLYSLSNQAMPQKLIQSLCHDEAIISQIDVTGQNSNNPPLVSVIMPTYNRASIIGKSIETVIEQHYTNWELLICDDASSDDTEAVVTKYGDSRIHYTKFQKIGAAAARNKGLESARGSIIAYLDSDNYWHPFFLAAVVNGLLENPGHSSLYADYIDFHVDRENKARIKSFNSHFFNHEELLKKPFIDLNSFVHHRELYDCFGGFNENLSRRQDYDLILKYTWLRDPLHLKHLMVLYHRNDNLAQITHTKKNDNTCIPLINQTLDDYFKNGLPVKDKLPIRKVTILSWDLCRNHFSKPFALAEALSRDYEVQLISFRFFEEKIFPPLKGVTPAFETLYLPGTDFPDFFKSMKKAVDAIDGDLIYVVKPRLPSLGIALLANCFQGIPLILEINDLETVVSSPKATDRHLNASFDSINLNDPALISPYSDLWSQLMDASAKKVSVKVTHNKNIDAHFSNHCLYMRNLKDEQIYDPAAYDRDVVRAKLGFSPEDRIILFGGLLRRHKGIYELVELVDRLSDPRYKLLFVGSRATPDQERLVKKYGDQVHILPPQDREAMARINYAADLVILWLNPDVPASHYQMPYKATDAFAMGPVIIANDISDFGMLASQGYLRIVPFGHWDSMKAAIIDVFDNPAWTLAMRKASRRLFLRQFSDNAARANFELAARRALDISDGAFPGSMSFARDFNRFYQKMTGSSVEFITPVGDCIQKISKPVANKASQRSNEKLKKHNFKAVSSDIHQSTLNGFFSDINAPDNVNIVFYTCGDLELLRRGIISLNQHTDLSKNTLFVIDDSQNSIVGEKIDEWTRNIGFFERVAYQKRKGIASALTELFMTIGQGDFCILTDGVVVTPDWLMGLKNAAYRDQRIGWVSPVTLSHNFYSFSMNPGDNIITCSRKLSMVSARLYPIVPMPDINIFYLKQAAIRQCPLPPFQHTSIESYFFDYSAVLSKSGKYCILADDTFVYTTDHLKKMAVTTDLISQQATSEQDKMDFGHKTNQLEKKNLMSLKNYSDSDIRLYPDRTLAVFFQDINLNGGNLVLIEFCNDLILKGWNIIAVLLSKRQKETLFFDFLFEPYFSKNAYEISTRLGSQALLMATYCKTAKLVSQVAVLSNSYTPFYFIQDFEVMFYDSPDDSPDDSADQKEILNYEKAVESYQLDLNHLITSDWIAAKVRSFIKKPDHAMQKIRIGFNPELFYPGPKVNDDSAPQRILAMVRPRTPRRGFSNLVRTLTLVYERNPDIEIFLYGTNDLSQSDVPFPFHNIGVVHPGDLRKYYKSAQIYIDTSLFHGFGLTGLEAMACGCACVLTDSGGPMEYVENEENSLLVPPGDNYAQARAVLRLLADKSLRKHLSVKAIETAQNFSIHHAADDFEKISGKIFAAREAIIESKSADRTCCVIVPVFNQVSAVRNCLESIENATRYPYRVIVVDDGSDNHTASFLRQFVKERPNYTYVRNKKNLGFVGSVNAGMQATMGEDIVLLNSDTIVTPGWLTKLVRCAQSDPLIGIISPLSNSASRLWIKPNPGETIFETAKHIEAITQPRYPDVVTPEGWCFYIRRRVYETLGGFDPVYGKGYCEESDFSMRAMANGWRTVCCEDTFIFHEGRVTFKGQGDTRYQKNRRIFDQRWKHYYKRKYRDFKTCNPLGKQRLKHRSLVSKHWQDPALVPVANDGNIEKMLSGIASVSVLQNFRQFFEDPSLKAGLWEKAQGKIHRVVFLIHQMALYGGILTVIQLANDLVKMGLDVKVVVLTTKKYQEFPGLLTRPIYFDNYDALIANFPPADAVVATLWTTVYYMAAIFKQRSDFLPLYFVQDFEPDFYPVEESKIRDCIEDTYRFAPYMFAMTPWVCSKIGQLGKQVAQVPPIMDLDLFYPRDISGKKNSPKKILTLLRPQTPQRGFDTAVKVLKKLYEARQDIEIHVFGCDDQELHKYNLSFPLVNHGIVDNKDLPELYSSAHIFVEFSNFHGFGLTIAEAMACGCACVITDSGGVSLFARHEENVLIAPPRDISGLFSEISRLCDDEDLHRRLATNARKAVMKFDHRYSAQEIMTFFRQSLNKCSQSKY